MRRVSGLLLALIMLFCTGGAHAGETLKLLPRSQVVIADPGLTPAEWRWVREHRKVRLAVWLPMSPPYDITTGLNDYGGINADFIGLIAENLGVEIDVIRYADYAAALAALQAGKADFIAQAADNQRQDNLLLSQPYSLNTAVEVVNTDEAPDDVVKKIAVSSAYDRQAVLARYPGATIIPFSSSRHALEALAFRQIDLFFCDVTTARYLVSQSNLSNLRIRPLDPPFSAAGFSFAAMPRYQVWINVLNKLLRALPESASVEIYRRWNGGIPLSLSEQRPLYTSLEQKWIKEHEHIRVAVADDNGPVAFFTEAGRLRGIIADILTALRLRTGFTFDIQRYPTQRAALEAVKKGRADLVAGGTQEDIWREDLITTRTWLYNSWVMVGKEHHVRGTLNPMVVSLDGQSPDNWLNQQSDEISEKVDTWRQGLDRVAHGEFDMMAMPLIIANAQLANPEYSTLRILASVDIDPMRYSFGASRRAWPLITILNKALINIPPEDLHALTRGGGNGNSFSSAPETQSPTGLLLAVSGLLLLLVIAGGYYGFRQRHAVRAQFDAVPFPLFICNREGVIRMANEALCTALSQPRSEIQGRPLSHWFNNANPFAEGDSRTVRHNGRTLFLWRAPFGRRSRFIGGWTDASRQQAFAEKLIRNRRRADDASRAKTAFLTTMSHEIRTPVSVILGLLELMMKRPDDAQKNAQSVQVAWDAAQSLLLLIGNILDVSRIESGRLVLRPERVALRELIEETAMLFEGMAAQKHLAFRLELDAGISGDVLADRSRLRQIVVNLVSNAIKYTERGQVTLRVDAEAREGDYLGVSIDVEDTGPGIDEETLARLFQPFSQGNEGNVAQGSGLGLYICRSLAQMMGGSVKLNSESGGGTQVHVQLRLPVMSPLNVPLHSAMCRPQNSGLNVLVVDDNPAGRMLLLEQLNWLGHRASGAVSAAQALEEIALNHPDAVITDCNMPDVSGYTLAQHIVERYPDLPVFGVTADARETARSAALEAGMRDCLFKPLTLNALADLLGDVAPAATPWNGEADLPVALLEGKNLAIFLSLQIDVIDETLHQLAQWHDDPTKPLRETLHKLRGGIQLLGVTALEQLCEAQERHPNDAGILRLEAEIIQLRAELLRWRDTGLQPPRERPTAY